MYSDRINVNVKGLLLALVAIIALLAYGLPALSSRNPLWFVRSLGSEPAQIITYRNGERQVLRPGTENYGRIAPLCTKALVEVEGVSDTGLSDQTMRDIRSQGRAIEVFFPEPITIPVSLPVGKPNQVFFPLDDNYREQSAAYTGNDGKYWASGLRIRANWDALRSALDALPTRQ